MSRVALDPRAPGASQLRILPDAHAVAKAAASEFAASAKEAIARRGVFCVALSGGKTPSTLYRLLAGAPYREGIDWRMARFFWGDERCVPPGDARSNYKMAKETLLEPLGVPEERIFRMRGEDKSGRAARAYELLLRRQFRQARGFPKFDLVLLGLGEDGHTASLFPGSPALKEIKRWVCENYSPKLRQWRLTLTYPVFNAARSVLFLVSGRGKSAAVSKILKREPGYRAFPASGIRPRSGALLWILDEAAASLL